VGEHEAASHAAAQTMSIESPSFLNKSAIGIHQN
jgi:hypothetical protein